MPPTSAAVARPASAPTSATTTWAPSAAKRSAMARPIPLRAAGDHGHLALEPGGHPACPSARSPVAPSLRWSLAAVPRPGRHGHSVEMNTFFTSVKASGASGPSSRPIPDCLKPPKGVQ